MDNLNVDTPSHGPYEDRITLKPFDNASESEACLASNNDTTNAHKTVKWDSNLSERLSEDYLHYFVGIGDCVSNSTPNPPEIGNCIRALVFNIFNTSNTGNAFTINGILENDTSSTTRTCECPTYGLSMHDEPCTKDFSEYFAASVSSKKIMIDIFRIITKLIKICFTHEELNGKALKQIKMELEDLQDKGMYTDKIAYEIQEITMKHCPEEINLREFYIYMKSLMDFSRLEKYVYAVNADAHRIKNLKQIKILTETGQLSDEMLFSLDRIDNGIYDIQRDFVKLNLFDIPGIVDFMKTLMKLGLLSKVLLHKLTNIGKEAIELSTAIHSQICLVDDTIKVVERLLQKYDLDIREKELKKLEKQLKGSICRYEHNIPLCGNCGWRNSWVKAFKKRGIYIKVADNVNENPIWINSIK